MRAGKYIICISLVVVCTVGQAASVSDRSEALTIKKSRAADLLERGENQKAVVLFEQLLKEVPVGMDGLEVIMKGLRLGCSRIKQGWRFEKAVKAYGKRIDFASLKPGEERKVRTEVLDTLSDYYHDRRFVFAEIDVLEQMLLIAGHEQMKNVETRLARAYGEAGYERRALDLWLSRVKSDKDDTNARMHAVQILFGLGEVEQGMSLLDGILSKPDITAMAARYLLDARILDKAEELALKVSDKDDDARETLVWVYYEQKRFAEAADIFAGLCEKEEDEGRLFGYARHLADTYSNQGILAEKIEQKRAEETSVRNLIILTEMQRAAGRHEEALETYFKYFSLAGATEDATFRLSDYATPAVRHVLSERGPEEAEKYIERLKKMHGAGGIGLNVSNYLVLMRRDEKEAAEELLEKMIADAEGKESHLSALVSSLEEFDCDDACARVCNVMLEIEPHDSVYDANAHAFLARYYYNLKEYEKAIQHLDKLDAALMSRSFGLTGEEAMRMMEVHARFKVEGEDSGMLMPFLSDKRLLRREAAAHLLARYGTVQQIPAVRSAMEHAPPGLRTLMEEAITGINARSLPGNFEPGEISENELEGRLSEYGFVVWIKKDPVDKDLRWAALEREFIASANMKTGEIIHYRDAAEALGLTAVSVTCIAFTEETVWVGTENGLLAYERSAGKWAQYAVGGEMVSAGIESVSVEGELLYVETTYKGRSATFALDTGTDKWTVKARTRDGR